ncbi:MAG: hypothetical protein MZV64_70905 [Ignavibacteriales bacterium]|nr:hypothetical protein [Ignavibacteriales bacterium]
MNAGFVATLANPIAPAVIYPDGEAERQGAPSPSRWGRARSSSWSGRRTASSG